MGKPVSREGMAWVLKGLLSYIHMFNLSYRQWDMTGSGVCFKQITL